MPPLPTSSCSWRHGADVFQDLVAVVLDVDPVDVDARRHDVADGAVADAEHAADHLMLLMAQKPRLLAGGDQKLQLVRRMQRFLRRGGLKADEPQHQIAEPVEGDDRRPEQKQETGAAA